jgi:serine/threonine-protein kinase RIO1
MDAEQVSHLRPDHPNHATAFTHGFGRALSPWFLVQAHVAYLECVKMMWRMYNEAKLVHGDLSEYNILYWRNECVFIDVSQSVEHDHPSAFDFLRKDCENICAFFRASLPPRVCLPWARRPVTHKYPKNCS